MARPNPKHLFLRANRDDGTIWITYERFREPIRPVKDVTNEVLLALCADLSADGVTQTIEREVKFSDGWNCKVTVEVMKED